MDELLKGFIEILDGVKSKMLLKVDSLTENNIGKFKQYHQAVDQTTAKANEMMRRVEAENTVSVSQMGTMDPLSRDIETVKLKKQSAQRIEELLNTVKRDVHSQNLLERFQEFKLLSEHKVDLYDEKEADTVYRRLINDLSDNIKIKPALSNSELVRDPFSNRKNPVSGGTNPSAGFQPVLPSFNNPRQDPNTSINNRQPINDTRNLENSRIHNNTTINDPNNTTYNRNNQESVQSLIMQQNYSIFDRGSYRAPKLRLEKTIVSPHSQEITCFIALNQRYIATASADKTVQVWDMENPGSPSVAIMKDFDSEVGIMRKILIDQSHPLGHLLITIESEKSRDNIAVFDLTSPSSQVPSVYSKDVSDKVNCVEVLNQNNIIVCYLSGSIIIYDVNGLSPMVTADMKTQVDALLVLPDRKTVIVAYDNEFVILEVSPGLQVTTRAKRKDKATFDFFRSLGRNSEVFCGFLKNGMVKMYRASDGECLNVILGQRGQYDSSLVLNFFSNEPTVYLISLSRHSPHFSQCSVDDAEMRSIEVENARYSMIRGEPKMQVIDVVAGKSLTFATVSNVGKQPSLWVWRLVFNSKP